MNYSGLGGIGIWRIPFHFVMVVPSSFRLCYALIEVSHRGQKPYSFIMESVLPRLLSTCHLACHLVGFYQNTGYMGTR